MDQRRTGLAALSVVAALVIGACAPSISPLYRDYAAATPDPHLRTRVERALERTRWEVRPSTTPNVIATDTVTLRRWGLYSVEVSLEVAPIDDRYVRVLVHPYRHYFTGGRRKIPYFKRSLRRQILPELSAAFEAEGLQVMGSSVERDRASRRRQR